MKVAVIGAGAVGAATVLSLIERGGMCREIVVLNRRTDRAALREAAHRAVTVVGA